MQKFNDVLAQYRKEVLVEITTKMLIIFESALKMLFKLCLELGTGFIFSKYASLNYLHDWMLVVGTNQTLQLFMR